MFTLYLKTYLFFRVQCIEKKNFGMFSKKAIRDNTKDEMCTSINVHLERKEECL